MPVTVPNKKQVLTAAGLLLFFLIQLSKYFVMLACAAIAIYALINTWQQLKKLNRLPANNPDNTPLRAQATTQLFEGLALLTLYVLFLIAKLSGFLQ